MHRPFDVKGMSLKLAAAAMIAAMLLVVWPARAGELEGASTASRPETPAAAPAVDAEAPPALARPTLTPEPPRTYLILVLAANAVGAVGTTYMAVETHANAYEDMAPYMLASPVVHLGYGSPGRATLSFLAHGIPILTTLGGAYLDSRLFPCTGDCDVPAFGLTLLGLVAGAGVAGLIDVALVASAEHAPATAPPPPPPVSVSFAPGLIRGGGVLGLAGTF